MKDDPVYRLCVDVDTGRPGCVLLQAMGAEGDFSYFLHSYCDIWLLAPTNNMAWVKGPESLFKKLFNKEIKVKMQKPFNIF